MVYVFGLMYMIMFLMNMIFMNVVVWWMVFVISVVFFIWMMKITGKLVGAVNYFIVQESLSLMFLFFSGSLLQFLVLLAKSGVAPMHFWIFSVGCDLSYYMLMWFLVIQKLPFIPVILVIYEWFMVLILILGLMVCHFQYLTMKSENFMLMISSTESVGWLIMILSWSYYSFIMIMLVYMIMLMQVLGAKSSNSDVDSMGWENTLLFMNFPLGLVFITKFFVLSLMSYMSLMVIVLFFSVVMVYMCLMYWLISVTMELSGVWSSKMITISSSTMVVLLLL